MRAMHEVDRTWKVGKLARATGLTVRALHHYDEIGLLVPGRTESGHRVYSRVHVERLYRVLALRGVGIALDEIGSALDDNSVTLIDTVRRHVAAVERDIEQRRRLLDRERILPIWIGPQEAAALVLQRLGATLPRPLGHDLMVTLLGAVDARVERVVIERLEDNTFYAAITVTAGGDPREVDARPSDALNLAVRSGAPIHVASSVFDAAGRTAWPDALETANDPPPWTAMSAAPPARLSWTPVGERRTSARLPTNAIDPDSPRMLRLAAAQARELGHGFVGDAHLLLGILADDDDAARLLHRHGITVAPIRDVVGAKLADPRHPPAPEGTMCMTAGAMYTMERASNEARPRGTLEITPMHLLRALLDSPEAADIFGRSDDLASVRDDVRAELDA